VILANRVAGGPAGKAIEEVFRYAGVVAGLHSSLTSPRGNYFRFVLLQAMQVPLDQWEIDRMSRELGMHESHRHLHRLMGFGLVAQEARGGPVKYVRTEAGERAVNAVRQLETRTTREGAARIYQASLGPNCIRLFLRVYGHNGLGDWDELRVSYTPAEMGRFALFLPRVVERISAVDRLNEADLATYGDDNWVHLHPVKCRSFYQYLLEMLEILRSRGLLSNPQTQDPGEAAEAGDGPSPYTDSSEVE
jgi:hypothetical protein